MADLFAPWGFWPGLPCAIEAAPPPFATLDAVLLDLPTLELRGRLRLIMTVCRKTAGDAMRRVDGGRKAARLGFLG